MRTSATQFRSRSRFRRHLAHLLPGINSPTCVRLCSDPASSNVAMGSAASHLGRIKRSLESAGEPCSGLGTACRQPRRHHRSSRRHRRPRMRWVWCCRPCRRRRQSVHGTPFAHVSDMVVAIDTTARRNASDQRGKPGKAIRLHSFKLPCQMAHQMATRCAARLIAAIRAIAVIVVDLAARNACNVSLITVASWSAGSACSCA